MQRQWSLQAPGEPEAEPGGEELCEQEMERLCLSQQPVRVLPYAMVDKRFIRQLREPEGVKTSCWQQWRRRRQTVGRRLGEAARRLTRGCGLWEGALYEIGGLFGTGIQSYFTFLRFLLLLNLLTLLLTSGFILLPLVWLRPPDPGPALNFTLQCPGSGHLPQPGVSKFNNLLWNVFTGRAFNNTYLFYGAYQAGPESSSTYSIRLAYLLSPLACLLLCFCGILRRMVKGLPQKMFLGQDYRSPLSAKVFSSWDFCIRGQEAATIKRHEISNEFKMELEEGRHLLLLQQQTRAQRACHLLTYLRVNILIGLLVVGAISAIFWATKYSQDNKEESLFLLLQYLPPGVIALVNFLGPLLFVFLVQLENYPPNTEVNLTLIWCVVLKLASLGMFSFSLGQTVLCIGRNKTSCESYGYNACDYQVAGISIRASPLSSAKPHLFDLLAPLWSHLCERLWAELCTQQSPPGSAIRITLPCAEEAAPTGCLSCSPGLDFNLANKTPGTAPILQDPHIRWVRGGWGPRVVTDASSDQCWENSVGEELYKLSIFNFLLTVAFAFLVSLPRRMLVERFSGRFWAWLDREEFLVPKNVLDIVEGQTVTWMGLFYCPLLPLLNSVFIFLTFYIKKYTLLRNSRASPRRFRASSSIFFFQLVLLLGLLLAAVPLGYVVSSIRSSWDCGLFTNYLAPWQVVPELVALWLPPPSQRILYYLGSHAFSFPLLILLSLVLTVCISQSQASSRAIRRLRKQLVWVFALIVFSCIFGEGYSNTHDSQQQYCVFNRNEDACRYGSAIGVLAFLASAFFFVVDIYFPQISNATDRKYLVIGDLLFSALWTFLWFVGFCFLTNQWAATKVNDVLVGADSARAAITFSFFSIFSWGLLAFLAYQRYKAGVDEFIQNYVDPTPDPSTAYASYPGMPADTYQQPPFTQNAESTEGYQPPPVY